MPAGGGFRKKLVLRVEHFSSVLLLPLFFAFIGLRSRIGLFNPLVGLANLPCNYLGSYCRQAGRNITC